MKPVVALVGRPNVGKSTLFNRLTRSRAALVAEEPGLTRDRQYGHGALGDRPYFVVDTGGVNSLDQRGGGSIVTELTAALQEQTRLAVAEADAVILIVDGREGIVGADETLARELRRLGRPTFVAVNKCEGLDPDLAVAEAHALALGAPHAISAAHGDGVTTMMSAVLERLPRVPEPTATPDHAVVAVVGRPNVGKSTLVNALLGEERVLVSAAAGTTRDSIEIPLARGRSRYTLIDTAGVRRKTRVGPAIERFSVIKTLQAVDRANVVIFVLDAAVGVSAQDASLLGYVIKRGRAAVLVANKWDLVAGEGRARFKDELARMIEFAQFAETLYLSALRGSGIGKIFPAVDRAFASAGFSIPTGKLARVLQAAVAATPPPMVRGRRIRPKFAHQGGKYPPLIVVHGNQVSALSPSYRRYLAARVRQAFGLVGTPLRLQCREGDNPYRGRGRRSSRAK